MKWKIYKESEEKPTSPMLYVGTYGKYNDGSIDGEWVTLDDFDTYEDFVDYCKSLHKDEKDPEFMCQDFQGFPEAWYRESGLPTEEEWNKIVEFAEMSEDEKSAYEAYVDYGYTDASIEDFRDAYIGRYNSSTDFAASLIADMGFESAVGENADWYFDYDSFGRDMMYDYSMGDPDSEDDEGNPQEEDHYYDSDGHDMGEFTSNRQVAEDFVDDMGGVEQLGQETIQRYFDYEKFGDTLLSNDAFAMNGYYFWHN